MTKKWFKRVGMFSVGMYFLIGLGMLSISNCMSFSMKPSEIEAHFANTQTKPRFHEYRQGKHRIHYAEIGDPHKPMVLFVHGSPGSWDAFIDFFSHPQLLDKAHLVAVDRPGFGQSSEGGVERSLSHQAAAIRPILARNLSGKPAILVGHSYGGPVIARMAMDYPDQIGGLVFVAASIDPDLEKTKWFQIPADWHLFSWMIPRALVVSNREILALKGELEAIRSRWSDINLPVTVIQGDKDILVPAANADFAQEQLSAASVTMVRDPNLNHFIPWTKPQLISQAVLRHLEVLAP